jgi:hypothetical protein
MASSWYMFSSISHVLSDAQSIQGVRGMSQESTSCRLCASNRPQCGGISLCSMPHNQSARSPDLCADPIQDASSRSFKNSFGTIVNCLLFKTRNLIWRVIAPICRLAIQLLQASSVISDHHGERHFDDLTNLPITKRESDNVLIFTLRFWNIVRRYVLWAESWWSLTFWGSNLTRKSNSSV